MDAQSCSTPPTTVLAGAHGNERSTAAASSAASSSTGSSSFGASWGGDGDGPLLLAAAGRRRPWLRLVDGACPWGVIIVCPDRMGVTRNRLVIYPPGINETERRRLRVCRGLAEVGSAVVIASYVSLTGLIGPRTALGISTAALVGTGVVAFARAGDVSVRVRTMRATVVSGYPDPVSRDNCRKLKTLAATLIEADRFRQLGLISPIEYEMTWWRVYDQIEPDHSRPHRTHWWERTA